VSTACEHSSVYAALDRLSQQGFEVVTLRSPAGGCHLRSWSGE
jgi:cysteine sulfinate desulfinase/cysteine desulfurase-like protein